MLNQGGAGAFLPGSSPEYLRNTLAAQQQPEKPPPLSWCPVLCPPSGQGRQALSIPPRPSGQTSPPLTTVRGYSQVRQASDADGGTQPEV